MKSVPIKLQGGDFIRWEAQSIDDFNKLVKMFPSAPEFTDYLSISYAQMINKGYFVYVEKIKGGQKI